MRGSLKRTIVISVLGVFAVLAFVLVSASAIRAQQPDYYYIQDNNGKMVRVNRSEEEKRCTAQPGDLGRCLPLVTPGGQQVSVPRPAHPIPIQPFSDEQKSLLNGTAPEPTLPVFSIQPPAVPAVQPKSVDPIPFPKAHPNYVNFQDADVQDVRPVPKPYVNPCDAVCEQQKINRQQQNFNNGFAIGQSIGMGGVQIGQAIKRHREKVHAENMDWTPKGKHGERVINLANGTAFIIDKNGKMRRVEAPIGEQERILMEKLRKDLVAMSDADPNDVFTKMAVDGARSSWIDLSQTYCAHYPGAKYINLEGREQRCK